MKPLATLIAALFLTVEAQAALPRVVSTGVCADQYVVALAAPGQIAGLSPDARKASLSPIAAVAARYATVPTNLEALLAASPDLVIGEGYVAARMRPFLEAHGIAVTPMPAPETLDGVAQALRDLGRALARPEAGDDAARAFDMARAALAATGPAHPPPALYLLPTGTTAGAGTFIDEVMRLGGYSNLAADRGLEGWAHVPLETLVRAPPDIVLAGFFDMAATTALAGFSAAPLTRRTLAHAKVIAIPDALWVCPGPALIDAARSLRARASATPDTAP